MSFHIAIATNEKTRTQCYQLRHTVFVEEQGVPIELEIDKHDETDVVHYLGCFENEPVAAARIVLSEESAKLGRLVVLSSHRGRNLGAAMMGFMIDDARKREASTIVLDAQTYALRFYERLGFVAIGDEFMDAGIPHKRMAKCL